MTDDTILPDGRIAVYGLYIKRTGTPASKQNTQEYMCPGECADMNDLLNSVVIENKPFKEVIMDDMTELLGQD